MATAGDSVLIALPPEIARALLEVAAAQRSCRVTLNCKDGAIVELVVEERRRVNAAGHRARIAPAA